MKKIIIAIISIALLIFLAFLLFPKKEENGLTKVRLAEVTHSIFYTPQYAAISEGYFKEAGIDIELIY